MSFNSVETIEHEDDQKGAVKEVVLFVAENLLFLLAGGVFLFEVIVF